MQSGLKYLRLFENQNIKSQFLDTFTDRLIDSYWQMPQVAFAVWKYLAYDTGRIGELMRLGLFDETTVTLDQVSRLPGIDRIICIYGYRFEDTRNQADLLNQMCNGIVTGIVRANGDYEIHLDDDYLVDRESLETVSLSPGGNNKLIRCKTLFGVPLMIVDRMSWKIFLNVDDLDKI